MELEAESPEPNPTWLPVVPVQSETVAVATFQWKRLPITRKVLLRYVAYALAIVLACAALAYGVSAAGAASYGARTEIYYPLNGALASGNFLREDRALSTQLVAMKSHAVLDPVAAQFKMTYDALSKKELVSILENSEVVRIEVDDASAAKAQSIVGAIAKSYLKTQPDQDTLTEAFLNKQITSLESQIGSLTSRFDALEATRLASATLANPNPPVTPAETALQSQITANNSEVASLQSRLDAVTVDQLQQPHVSQLTQPYQNGKVAPTPVRAAAAGALAGIMIAAIALTMLLRRRIKRQPLDQLG